VQDLRPSNELTRRCRWLIENLGTKERRGQSIYRSYVNDMIAVEWRYPSPDAERGPDYPSPILTVRDAVTGETLVNFWHTSGGPRVTDEEAKRYLPYLRSVMLLEELARI
jgi:hypothetical protein